MALRYGYAQGNLVASNTNVLDGMKKLVGQNGMVRTDAKWSPGSPLTTSQVGPLADAIASRGMVWFACMHGVRPGGGQYLYPTDMAQWQKECQATASALIQKGVRNFNILNEPNTPTGNVGGTMTPLKAAQLAYFGAQGIKNALAAIGAKGQIYGPAVGTIDIDYLDKMTAAFSKWMAPLNGIDCHVYMNEDPSLPGGGKYIRRIRTLESLRAWMNANGASRKGIRITEGGYASSSDSNMPPNCLDLNTAAKYEAAALKYLKDNFSTLKCNVVCFYNPIDAQTAKYSGSGYDYAYWYQKLGHLRPDLSYKPTGTAFAAASGALA